MKQSTIRRISNIAPAKENVPLAPMTTFGVGGEAELLVVPQKDQEAFEVIKELCKEKVPYFVMGNGSNLLVSDSGYPGVVIKLGDNFKGIDNQGTIVSVGAAAQLWDLIKFNAEKGLTGMEELAGIPGTVGGALNMNAGAFNTTVSDSLIRVRGIDKEKCEMHWFDQRTIDFEYRKSPDKLIYLRAEFMMILDDIDKSAEKIKAINKIRAISQPLDKKSAGCVFKNPPGAHAGKIIDELGLKGLTSGDAEVSNLHANFIVVGDNAKASDIWQLLRMIEISVKKMKNITLEREIIPKGEFDGKLYV